MIWKDASVSWQVEHVVRLAFQMALLSRHAPACWDLLKAGVEGSLENHPNQKCVSPYFKNTERALIDQAKDLPTPCSHGGQNAASGKSASRMPGEQHFPPHSDDQRHTASKNRDSSLQGWALQMVDFIYMAPFHKKLPPNWLKTVLLKLSDAVH